MCGRCAGGRGSERACIGAASGEWLLLTPRGHRRAHQTQPCSASARPGWHGNGCGDAAGHGEVSTGRTGRTGKTDKTGKDGAGRAGRAGGTSSGQPWRVKRRCARTHACTHEAEIFRRPQRAHQRADGDADADGLAWACQTARAGAGWGWRAGSGKLRGAGAQRHQRPTDSPLASMVRAGAGVAGDVGVAGSRADGRGPRWWKANARLSRVVRRCWSRLGRAGGGMRDAGCEEGRGQRRPQNPARVEVEVDLDQVSGIRYQHQATTEMPRAEQDRGAVLGRCWVAGAGWRICGGTATERRPMPLPMPIPRPTPSPVSPPMSQGERGQRSQRRHGQSRQPEPVRR